MESKGRRVVQQLPDDLTNIEFETSEDVNVIPTFDSMGLREDLLRGIYAYGTCDFHFFFRPCSIIKIILNLFDECF